MEIGGARVLVTGVSGFVGGAMGRLLRARGAAVTGISRSPPRDGACDIHLAHDLAEKLPPGLSAFDAVVHCAALASPWARPADYRRANVEALGQVLAYAKEKPPRRFVFVSSSAVHYDWADTADVVEDTPWPAKAINLYAASKREGEAMVRASDLAWTIVRPRAVYGPGDTVVFPRILHAAHTGVLPLLTRADGVVPRADLLYIDNLTHYLARILKTEAGGVFLLTDGTPVEIPSLLKSVLERLGLPAPRRKTPVPVALAAAGAMELWSKLAMDWREPAATRFGVSSLAFTRTFDIARARTALGGPVISQADGLEAFIAWQRSAGRP